MRITKVRCLGRWAMAGCGLLTLGVFALSSGARPAIAADLGDDAYLAEEAAQYHRRSRGSGHTFDVPPDRHPQSVTPGQHRDQDFDRHAYRDGDKVDRYEGGDRYPPSHGSLTPSYGSLKDDVAPNQDAPRWGHQQRRHQRDYADRSVGRWADRRRDRWHRSQRCIPKRHIRRQLRRAGWRGFRRGPVRGTIRYMVARQRKTGEVYELAVDRCTGEVMSASFVGTAQRRGFGRDRFRNRRYRDDVVVRW